MYQYIIKIRLLLNLYYVVACTLCEINTKFQLQTWILKPHGYTPYSSLTLTAGYAQTEKICSILNILCRDLDLEVQNGTQSDENTWACTQRIAHKFWILSSLTLKNSRQFCLNASYSSCRSVASLKFAAIFARAKFFLGTLPIVFVVSFGGILQNCFQQSSGSRSGESCGTTSRAGSTFEESTKTHF